MNPLIKQLLETEKANIEKAYALAGECLNIAATTISDDIVYDNQNDIFVVKYKESLDVMITIEINKKGVITRISEKGIVVAGCTYGIDDSFEQSMTRMHTMGLRDAINKYFDEVESTNTHFILSSIYDNEEPVNEKPEDVETTIDEIIDGDISD